MKNALDKTLPNAQEALKDLFDNARIMSAGFGLSGIAENCIEEIKNSHKKNLTVISNNCGNQGKGLAILLKNKQVKKVICSFVGGNPDLEELMLNNQIEVELVPQGTFAERIRAAGAGIGGFFTPTGVGSIIAQNKEHRILDNKAMIFEESLKADFAILRAHVVDTYGNCRFFRTSRNFAPLMAMAAKITIVEAENIVELGSLMPDDIHLPGIFVNRIFLGKNYQNTIEHLKIKSDT